MESEQLLHALGTLGRGAHHHPHYHLTMRGKRLTTEPPNITEETFEDVLASDDLLVEYFNEFLSLPAFSVKVRFDRIYGVFELINRAPERLKQQMKKLLREQQPPNPIYDVTRHATITEPPKGKSSPEDLKIDNSYNVMCLNREQGVQWIKKERLPSFLKSDCYFEYRLAKLMSQVKLSNAGAAVFVDPRYEPWLITKELPPTLAKEDDNEALMKKFFVNLGQASISQTSEWFTLAKQSQHTNTAKSLSFPLTWGPDSTITSVTHFKSTTRMSLTDRPGIPMQNASLTAGAADVQKRKDKEEYSASVATCPSPSTNRVYLEVTCDTDNNEHRVPVFGSLEEFAAFYIDRLIKNAVAMLTGEPPVATDDGVDIYNLSEVIIQSLPSSAASTISSTSSEADVEEDGMSSESEIEDTECGVGWQLSHSPNNIRSRKLFEKFKSFLKGTSGENHWLLWLDIERLKALKDIGRQVSHLNKMKTKYLMTNGDHFLNNEILSRLNLLHASQWNIQYLSSIQTEIVKPLLLYWGPRFCAAHSAAAEGVTAKLKLWQARQLRPKRDVLPFPHTVTLLPLRAKSCLPIISTPLSQRTEISKTIHSTKNNKVDAPAKSRILSGNLSRLKSASIKSNASSPNTSIIRTAWSRPTSSVSHVSRISQLRDDSLSVEPKPTMQDIREDLLLCQCKLVPWKSELENMLQALHLDSRAGFHFTHFCEKSENELWKNSAYFWFDLQAYHHLFYHETLQPFKLKRQAQLLFATYLAPGSAWDIGVEQCVKREIYQKLNPPFEDLFDLAEEYILNLLMNPWILMIQSHRNAFEKVELVEETRQLDSVYFRKLQALYEESTFKKDEGASPGAIFLPPPDNIKEPNLWEQVPVEYRNYNLSFLINHRLELEHFRTFLDDHFASIDLMCWIEIERFRRMPYKEREKREEKSKDIKTKYLNKKYFFGPNSPATRQEQEQVMQLGGGWGKILQDRLASAVLLEVQKYVRMRIEKKWLPLFLATDEYNERQKVQDHMKDVAEDVMFQTQKKKMGVYKHLDSKWISSSKEIIEFRKALLNPVTVKQFQHFVSLKNDFLENDLLFWLEVQKYKDLCHSYCDDATIQNKISTIINCFINSSIPPALQIDISQEQAEKILEHRRDLGPYVFREAQMVVFSILFSFWHEFCEFRSNLTDQKPDLERKRDKDKKKRKFRAQEDGSLASKNLTDLEMNISSQYFGLPEVHGRVRRTTVSDIFDDFGSIASGILTGPNKMSWSYSKYIEALEQERMLLKVKEDLERKTATPASSSFFHGGGSSIPSAKSDLTRRKTLNSISAANFEKAVRSPPR
ncbi:regulator of G-protein signaling 22 isoform X2 [Lissotriton helveticus]